MAKTATAVQCGWSGCKNHATHILHHKFGVSHKPTAKRGNLPCCAEHLPVWAKSMKQGEETAYYRVEIL